MMKKIIEDYFQKSIAAKSDFLKDSIEDIETAVKSIVTAFKGGNKMLVFGNGGSASDSLHIAAEFVGRFRKERRALPVISLSSNVSAITALANDYGYDVVFMRQLEAFHKKGDISLAISTSGNSESVVKAAKFIKSNGGYVISFTGGNGGKLVSESDICFIVPSGETSIVQEVHITLAHLICLLVEEELF
ncbi:MAG: SIS domain-containing protein [Candidatus Omnitrophica bacterium]|nr:SIS domain-containing protein [Candidatus Omnitrophota bacterium]